MTTFARFVGAVMLSAGVVLVSAQSPDTADGLARHRNLGKAFYENPTTQSRAVDEFKAALDLAPASARERVNYGLALLRAGRQADGIAELQRAQTQDPSIPHTWFNLGIAYKKDAQYERAAAQFERMVSLVPDEAVSHYNLGYLYRLLDRTADALREFETSARLDPNLAGPHFQLYNAYRAAGRTEDAAREEATFQALRRRQANAAVPEDLDWSYYAEILDPLDAQDALDTARPVDPTFEDVALPGRFDAATAGLLTTDLNGDGRPDVIAWSGPGLTVFPGGESESSYALESAAPVTAVAAADIDNDGLPELCVVTPLGATLFANVSGTLRASSNVVLPQRAFSAVVWMDYDHDYDVDLLLLGPSPAVMRNNGRAGFSDETAALPLIGGRVVDAVMIPTVADTPGLDLLVTYADRPSLLYKDLLGGKFEARPLDVVPTGARRLIVEDVDMDGELDVVGLGPAGVFVALNRRPWSPAALASPARALTFGDIENRALGDLIVDGRILHNAGAGRFETISVPLLAAATTLAADDVDGDGRIDVAALRADGTLHLLKGRTDTGHRWLRLSLTGVRNPRRSTGAIVEVKAGRRYQKRLYDGTPLHFGVRDAERVDTVRITWPNGLIQNEIQQQAGRALAVREAQRLSGSCPMIFTWDGREHRFITDVLGVAPLGASAGDGTYFPVDHDEYVSIPGDALVPKDGVYDIRITEELREVSYLDTVQVIAVDHPSGIDIFSNDKFKSPPFPEFRLFGGGTRHYPVRATDGEGHDVLDAIRHRDRHYPDGFSRTYAGVAERHTLDLDFGEAAASNRAVLVLNGWVDWADGSTFRGASQENPGGLEFPSIQVQDASGRWVMAIADMGIPAGKPKTIAVDLTGRFLSSSRKVRIVTSLALYWDEIFLLDDSAAPPAVLTPVPARTATLDFRGFSTPTIHPRRTQPESFDYGRVLPATMWNPTPGLYTRFGDVTPLIHRVDDQMVIMGSGDELRLTFDAAAVPPLRAGWTRDFLLLVDGWAKDADPNTAFSQSVEPLPFHAMSAYPYPPGERYPEDAAHQAYRRDYNPRPALRVIRPLPERPVRPAPSTTR